MWPLIHYHPGEITFSEDAWQGYKRANRKFAETVARDLMEGDMIWIHDYHLMLVPAMLREIIGRQINIKIGFFLHTPFPSSEIFRILPVRLEILKGVLQADLIGFHTNDYARHFLSSCWILLYVHSIPTMLTSKLALTRNLISGLPTTTATVTFRGRTIKVGAFPIGIDPSFFTSNLISESVQSRLRSLEDEFSDTKVMVGVDRLDYVKGVPQKLRAFEILLETHPEWVGKVVLIQVAIPTRGEVEEYKNLRYLVNELVGRINGKFGTFEYTPIHFMHQSVTFPELLALYAISDVCVEYIACQQDRKGSLILSEFAGSAQSLAGALVVNPWNEEEMARAILRAVTMDTDERNHRWEKMVGWVRKHTSAFWGESFVRQLMKSGEEQEHKWLQVSHDPLPTRIDWRSYDG